MRRVSFSSREASSRMTAAPTTRETSVGMATPSTPQCSQKMHSALPTTLIRLTSTLTRIETALLPVERKMAAPAL